MVLESQAQTSQKVASESRLTSDERTKIVSLAESLVKKEDIFSLCAYGSRVAGYAKADSDYDFILVTKSPKEKRDETDAKRAHEKEAKSAPLIVDEVTLLNDAKHASPGDFVVGRFLNVYEPMVNPEFLLNVELEYKKRVLAEELIELQTDYGDFSSNLVIPYEYFLFDRLHKRAAIYPETMYGYTRTYTCAKSGENLEVAIRGFREAADSLASSQLVESTDGSVRILRGKRRSTALSGLLKMYPLTPSRARSYAFHAFANRIGFEFKPKPVSRLKATGKVHHPPLAELDRPKKLLRLHEGVVFGDPEKMIEEVATIVGFRETYDYEEKKMGDLINSTKQLKIWDEEKQAKFILKHFPELKAAKWLLLNMWSLGTKKFNKSPLSRLNREVEGVRRVRELGMKTHRIIGVVLDERTLVTEYVEGVPLSEFVAKVVKGESTDTHDIEAYARVLGKLHKGGIVYGDTKPQNVLVGKDGGIELLDLEQAVEDGDMAWDLAEFLYFSATNLESDDDDKKQHAKEDEGKKAAGVKLVADSFLEAYRSENGAEVIARAKSMRYFKPFVPVVSRKMMEVIQGEIERYSSSSRASA